MATTEGIEQRQAIPVGGKKREGTNSKSIGSGRRLRHLFPGLQLAQADVLPPHLIRTRAPLDAMNL